METKDLKFTIFRNKKDGTGETVQAISLNSLIVNTKRIRAKDWSRAFAMHSRTSTDRRTTQLTSAHDVHEQRHSIIGKSPASIFSARITACRSSSLMKAHSSGQQNLYY